MIRRFAADLHLAAVFLTRLPLPRLPADPPPLAGAMWAFPLVGAGVGLIGAGVLVAASALGLGPWVGALLALGVALWVTGGLHEDGLADVADGFGGGQTRDRKLEIMRDSRIGSYGVLALIVALGLKVAALAQADALTAAAALVAAGALGRAAPPLAMLLAGPARTDGLGAGAGTGVPGAAAIAWGLALALALGLAGRDGFLACGLALLATFAVVALARRAIGGYTGDVLGAAVLVAEVAVLVVLTR
ncbi:adenosylcobinamide-GDP ribazoletransferase [Novispirillum sp. DQ9]|uniref:adenosylcobinamide-GDP ribazoletransferase n=1 Tax=Novispirillum sp. DQ9 TaxID=3398612 RepID=UPI003C7E240B